MRTAPTLKHASAKITYTASDGYRAEVGYSSARCPADKPHEALLGAFEELSRILHLFGFGKEALQRAEKIGDQTIVDLIANGYLQAIDSPDRATGEQP